MTDHTARLYALIAAVLVFFVAWAAVAARPWATSAATTAAKADPRIAALALREQRVRAETLTVQRILAKRQAAAGAVAPAPAVKVVTLPPLTITRTS